MITHCHHELSGRVREYRESSEQEQWGQLTSTWSRVRAHARGPREAAGAGLCEKAIGPCDASLSFFDRWSEYVCSGDSGSETGRFHRSGDRYEYVRRIAAYTAPATQPISHCKLETAILTSSWKHGLTWGIKRGIINKHIEYKYKYVFTPRIQISQSRGVDTCKSYIAKCQFLRINFNKKRLNYEQSII